MKKLLFFISFLFMTVCYAAPPPDVGGSFVHEELSIVADQDVLNVIVDVPDQGIEAQEVAFNYIGNDCYLFSVNEIIAETVMEIKFAELRAIASTLEMSELYKPPSNNTICGVLINRSDFLTDMQHSNFGYPFTAN